MKRKLPAVTLPVWKKEELANQSISEQGLFDEDGDLVAYITFLPKGKDEGMVFIFDMDEIFLRRNIWQTYRSQENPQFSETMEALTPQDRAEPQTFDIRYQKLLDNDNYLKKKIMGRKKYCFF